MMKKEKQELKLMKIEDKKQRQMNKKEKQELK